VVQHYFGALDEKRNIILQQNENVTLRKIYRYSQICMFPQAYGQAFYWVDRKNLLWK